MRVENEVLIAELARLLAEEKEVQFTPSGNSMRPFIEGDEDSVVLAPMVRKPRRGDIVLAHATAANGRKVYVLHRIVAIKQYGDSTVYVLQGDGNLSGFERCSSDDIIGRVIRVLTKDGQRKWQTRGIIWCRLRPIRKYLLKIYRRLFRKNTNANG